MGKRTGRCVIALLVIAIVLITSCDLGLRNTGSIAINFGKSRSVIWQPELDMSLASYTIKGSGPTIDDSFEVRGFTDVLFVRSNLAVGRWTFTIDGYNSEDEKIATFEISERVRRNQMLPIRAILRPLEGEGRLSVTMGWEDSLEILESPSATLIIRNEEGDDIEGISDPVALEIEGTTATVTDLVLPVGWYEVTLSLEDEQLVWQRVFALRIVYDNTTVANVNIPETLIRNGAGTGGVVIEIEEDMDNPLDIWFSGLPEQATIGTPITLQAEGLFSHFAQYRWYVDGIRQDDQSGSGFTYTFTSPGPHAISVFVLDEGALGGYEEGIEVFLAPLVGEGTEDNPYIINEAIELETLRQLLASPSENAEILYAHIHLASDIDLNDLNDIDDNWTPIEHFGGVFDGQGHSIANLRTNRPGNEYVGFFGVTFGATIRNLSLTNVKVEGNEYVGSLVGRALESTISNVEVDGSVTGNSFTGGLAGASGGSIEGTAANVTVTGYASNTGGLVGYLEGNIDSSFTIGEVTGSDHSTGGLVGYSDEYASISDSHTEGNVFGDWDVGGLVGFSKSTITCSYATGKVTGNISIGGLVGYSASTIYSSYATGEVSGNTDVGGLVGYTWAGIQGSHARGKVLGSENVGGLAGSSESTITSAYATGSVYGTTYVGGLVGYAWADITSSYATGTVTGAEDTGGLVGHVHTANTLNSTYASGSVLGKYRFGGLVGSTGDEVAIRNSVAANLIIQYTSMTDHDTTGHRIVGSFGSLNSRVSNYAHASMTLPPGLVTEKTHDGIDGANATLDELKSYLFYKDGSRWDETSTWSNTEVWSIIGGTLPKLAWQQ